MNKIDRSIWWITGKAASGKSTFRKLAVEELQKQGISTVNFCDEEEMFRIVDEDSAHEHHFHPYGDERFLFKDCYPFDEGLRRISYAIEKINEGEVPEHLVVIVELARGAVNEVLDLSFRRGFEIIKQQIIDASTFFYINSNSRDQLERNRKRGKDGISHTPEEIMKGLYLTDDFDWAKKRVNFEVINNQESYDQFISDCIQQIRSQIANLTLPTKK